MSLEEIWFILISFVTDKRVVGKYNFVLQVHIYTNLFENYL